MSLHTNADVPRKKNGHNKGAHVGDRTLSHGEPAKPLLRVLPIKRWIPMDVHSMLDYGGGLMTLSGYFAPENDDDSAACWASMALGAGVIGVSLMTDYRLSAVKLIPIRVHETADYLWGASAVALPFLLGYWKSSPRVAITHIMAGASTIIGSLFTDYRSYKAEKAKRGNRRAHRMGGEGVVMPT